MVDAGGRPLTLFARIQTFDLRLFVCSSDSPGCPIDRPIWSGLSILWCS